MMQRITKVLTKQYCMCFGLLGNEWKRRDLLCSVDRIGVGSQRTPGWQLVCTADTSISVIFNHDNHNISSHINIYIYIYFKSIPEVIILHHWWKPICLGLANLPDGVSGERFGYLAHGRGPGGDSPFMKFMQCVKSWLINLGYASTRKWSFPYVSFICRSSCGQGDAAWHDNHAYWHILTYISFLLAVVGTAARPSFLASCRNASEFPWSAIICRRLFEWRGPKMWRLCPGTSCQEAGRQHFDSCLLSRQDECDERYVYIIYIYSGLSMLKHA